MWIKKVQYKATKRKVKRAEDFNELGEEVTDGGVRRVMIKEYEWNGLGG